MASQYAIDNEITRTMTAPESSPVLDGYAISPVQRNMLRTLADPARMPCDLVADIELAAPVSADRLLQAITDVARRHDVLCSDYRQLPGMAEPVQVPRPGARVEVTNDAADAFPINEPFVLRLNLVERTDRCTRLRCSMPSFLADPASLARLTHELAAALDLTAAPSDEDYPRYADVAQFLAETGESTAGKEFWQAMVAEAADAPIPAVGYQEARVRELSFALDRRTMAAVRGAATHDGWSMRDIVLGAYYLLLHRLTGQRVLLALNWSAREAYPELAGVFGPLTFDVPMSLPIPEGTGFRELQADLRRLLERVDEHALAVPSAGGTVASAPPRFRADFSRAQAAVAHTGLAVSVTDADSGAVDLALSWLDFADGACQIRFNPQRYAEQDIVLFFDRLQTVLRRVCENPAADMTRIQVMSDEEFRRTVVEFNATDRDYDAATVVARFREQVRARPDAIAVRGEVASLTYGEVADRAERIAGWLMRQGVGRGDFVPLYLERQPEAIAAMIGVLLTGAAYVPLNTALPAKKITSIVARIAPKAVLASRAWAARLELPPNATDAARLTIDAPDAPLPALDVPVVLPGPDDPAYVIFTSGSTGEPKGVVVAHKRLTNVVDWINRTQRVGTQDCVLLVAAFSFDLSVYDVWGSLSVGASIRLVDETELADPRRLVDILCAGQVTIWDSAPAALQLLAPLFAEHAERLRNSALRLFMLSGDWIPVTLPETLRQHFTNPVVLAMGGATEATIWSNFHLVDQVDPRWPSVPYGRPMQNCRYYVLDPHGTPQPTGVPGELYIGGICVADGYFADPETTAARFLEDPFITVGGDKLYRTGDMVRLLGHGELQFLGRQDDQVKVRGHRIELGEVAAALRAHKSVKEAIIRSVRESDGNNALVAYWLPHAPDTHLDRAELTLFLAQHLPAYAVPAYTVRLDRIPVSGNGKVDYAALPDYQAAVGRVDEAASQTEATLRAIWQELLGHNNIGLEESFFSAGGHSLAAVRMLTKVQGVFGRRVRMPEFVAEATIRALARLVDGGEQASAPHRPVLARRHRAGLPVSHGQRRMWFLHQLEGPSPTYNIQQAVDCVGPLDIDALRTAFTDLMIRHEVLRTSYAETDGDVVQYVMGADEIRPPLELVDSSPDRLDEQIQRASRYCFDLSQEPPIRVWLFQIAPDHNVLLVVTHHIASDGTSEGVLLRDLATAYAGRASGTAPGWSPLPVQYSDYVLWQQHLLGAETDADSVVSQQLEYWRQELAGAPPALDLPFDRPYPAVPTHQGDQVEAFVDADRHQALLRLARDNDSTLFMVLQTAVAALLKRMGAGDDLPVGTGVAGRTDEALTDLVGFFINTLVLRTDASGNPTLVELLRRVRQTALGAFAHADIPFDRVVEDLVGSRSLSRSPLFQIMLMLRSDVVTDVTLRGTRGTVRPVNAHVAKFDLLLNVHETVATPGQVGTPAGLNLIVEYATDVFDATTVRRMIDGLLTLLDAMIADPHARVLDVELLDAAERHRILTEWNDTAHRMPPATVADLLQAQVLRTPDATAIVFGGTTATYAQLDERVQRLARLLIARGGGPGTVVALAIPRSVELVEAMLAAVITGAAYLPLDADYPADRIAYMVKDAAPVMVVATNQMASLLPNGMARLVLDAQDTIRDLAAMSVKPLQDAERSAPLLPQHPMYLMYTSGSTGRPKGVLVPHEGVVNWLQWMQDRYCLDDSDRVLLKTPASFDVSVREFFWPLVTGATLVIADPEGHKDPAYLAAIIQQQRVTTVHFVPSLLGIFLQEPAAAGCTTLRRVICSGEALPTDLGGQFSRVLDADLHNLYGPTEASVEVSQCQYRADLTTVTVPIGRPVWNTSLYVLDARLRPVPVGVPGELYLAGVCLAHGYRNRPNLTAERFIANPFGPPGSRMYRTGDLARWRMDATVEFLGRVDHQVKVRGLRIELGEIETVLARHETVAQAVVTIREASPGDKRLVAYVVPEVGREVEVDKLRRHTAEQLPPHMVPSAVTVLAALPLTTSGKVDRKALPDPDFSRRRLGRPPRTTREETLCELFAHVLGLERVGIDDGFFFDLGGNSLTAMRLMSRIRSAMAIELSVRTLFEGPTVEQLAAAMDTLVPAPTAPRPALRPLPRPEEDV